MRRSAASRFFTTLVVVASLLFMQLALAAYVCPVESPAGDEVATALDAAGGAPCHEHEANQEPGGQPVLCHQHCTNAAQSFEPLKLPALTLPAIVQVLIVPLRIDPGASQQAVASATLQKSQSPPSPVFLATLRLRV